MAEKEPEQEGRRGGRVSFGTIAAAGLAAAVGALALSRTRFRARLRAHEQAMKALAEEMNAQFTPSGPGPQGPDFPQLSGSLGGREFRVDSEVAGSSLQYRILTRATAQHKAPVEGFIVIREETVLTRVADSLGLADIQVGEPAFDDRFEVTSDMADAAKFLQPEIRDALLASAFESVVIRAREVIVRQNGPVTDVDVLRKSVQLAVDVAEWLETLS